jgi:hypothetical protein
MSKSYSIIQARTLSKAQIALFRVATLNETLGNSKRKLYKLMDDKRFLRYIVKKQFELHYK